MLIKVNSIAFQGLDPIKIDVEVNLAKQNIPGFYIIGLGDKAVSESKDRVRTAVKNSISKYPSLKIIVNLAPADVKKEGSFYDLPIAVGILSYMNEFEISEDSLFFGEVSLSGELKHTKGALLAALFASENGYKNLYLPSDCCSEAGAVKDINIFPVKTLREISDHLGGIQTINKYSATTNGRSKSPDWNVSIDDVLGQEFAKRALTVAAAGSHNMLMIGPPGSGKSMISKSIRSILPELSPKESMEVTKIYSAIGKIEPGTGLIRERTLRSPHHTTSYAGLIGGGSYPQPGEVSLAHRGVLFLDEFPEFSRSVLEALRQPMEDGCVMISRSNSRVTYPADFMLLASANPCQCGYYGSENHECTCTEVQLATYRKRLSGPILDRIDLHINVEPVKTEELTNSSKTPRSNLEDIRTYLNKTRELQRNRFEKLDIHSNSQMQNIHIKKYCRLNTDAQVILNKSIDKFNLSARTYFRLLKVARTIADLESAQNDIEIEMIEIRHIGEALQFRLKEFKYD
jgi:magnesium chelatase family protein